MLIEKWIALKTIAYKKKRFSIIIILMSLAALYGCYRYMHGNTNPHFGEMPVTALEVKASRWPIKVESIGNITARHGIILKASIAGPVTHIAFKSHDIVEKDQVLIEIHPGELRESVTESKAKLDETEADLKRIETLYHEGNASAAEFDKRRTALNVLKATIAGSESKYQLAVIHAPFKGQLGLRKVSLGDYLQPGDPIVGLYDLEHLRVDFEIPQEYVADLKVGDKVKLTNDRTPAQTFHGIVTSFDSYVDPSSRTLTVRANIKNTKGLLLPGMFVKLTLILKADREVIAIPQTAINYSIYGNTVLKIVNGQAVPTPVTTGMRDRKLVEILQGLNLKDQIVVEGKEKLQDHSKVFVKTLLTDPRATPAPPVAKQTVGTNHP